MMVQLICPAPATEINKIAMMKCRPSLFRLIRRWPTSKGLPSLCSKANTHNAIYLLAGGTGTNGRTTSKKKKEDLCSISI